LGWIATEKAVENPLKEFRRVPGPVVAMLKSASQPNGGGKSQPDHSALVLDCVVRQIQEQLAQ